MNAISNVALDPPLQQYSVKSLYTFNTNLKYAGQIAWGIPFVTLNVTYTYVILEKKLYVIKMYISP